MRSLSSVVWALALFFANSSHANYTFSLLAPIGGTQSSAAAINDLGQIVGASTLQSGNALSHATLWNAGLPVDLGGSSSYSGANDINNLGHVVGGVGSSAFLWTPGGSMSLLDTPSGYSSQADAINEQGTVVGSRYQSGQTGKATVWVNGVGSELSRESPGQASGANGINEAGRIAGLLNSWPLMYTAVVWDDGGRSTLSSGWSANDINDFNIVVGMSVPRAGLNQAVMWNGTSTVRLPGLGGVSTPSSAEAINNAGQIVGYINNRPVLWSDNRVTDLSLLPGVVIDANWRLIVASDINDRGDIVGTAVNDLTGERRGYVLSVATPVPEPAIWTSMLLGLAVVVRRIARQ